MKKGRRELALAKALRVSPRHDGDAAIVALATDYARSMDAGEFLMEALGELLDSPELEPVAKMLERLGGATTLSVLGAGYRQALESLGLTPRVRAALSKGEAPTPVSSPIDELRKRREKRAQ